MKDICLQMKRKVWLTLIMVLCLSLPALAQKITVQGTVVDPSGEPLIGASVVPAGTTSGTATDLDGHFSLEVSPKTTLVVSYVGYLTQRVPVNGQSLIKVTLKESSVTLNEVVAIGYGTVKKTDATGSVATVKPSEIQAGLATSAQDLLVGQTPGVVVTTSAGPEGSGTIRIRGGSSLNASNDPLIVVDGVPLDNTGVQGMGNSLSMIAPDNIESMTVLKDASATAIYGSRASNGVIIITTKKGKAGKPQVNLSINTYLNTARKTWKVLDGTAYSNIITDYFGANSDAVKALGSANTDWQDQILRTTLSEDYNLSIGGSVGFLPYRVAVTYTDNQGILKNTSMKRLTAGFNLTPKFFNGLLSVNANAKGYFIKNQFSDTGAVGAAVSYDPTKPVYTAYPMKDGSDGVLWNGYTNWMNGAAMNANSAQNPLAMINDKDDKANVWRSNGNLQLDLAVPHFTDLHLNLNVGYDVSKSNEHIYTTQNSTAAWRNYKKNGAATDYCVAEFRSNTLLDFYANYKKEVKSIFSNFDVTAGYSWQHFYGDGWNNGTLFTSEGYSSPAVDANGNYSLTLDNTTSSLIGTRYVNDANSDNGEYHWKTHLQLLSFFGRFNYTFKDRYLLTFTLRDDATSRFSKDNRWGLFPSVALGWKISDEPWMKSVKDVMNECKLRLGWGVTGQQDIGYYFPYLATYTYATEGSYYTDITTGKGYKTTLYPNGYEPNLKWEQTTTWNAGFDFGFLNNRITSSIDYYFRKTKDLLSTVTVAPGSSTTNQLPQNIGNLENRGVEFSIVARPVVKKDFTWTVSYNIAWNKNKITKLNNDNSYVTTGGISAGTGSTCQVQAVGKPAYSFYLYEQVYDKDGNPLEGQFVDQNGDGIIDDNDKVIRHSRDPKVTMTFSNQINWNNWDFGIALRANIGNYVYNDILANHTTKNACFQNSNLGNLIENDFYFDGTKTTADLAHSDYWLRNASFLRCDNITLGYTWPELIQKSLRLRVYGAVQNPFVITKYKGIDPEVFSGIDNSVYPRPITFTLGLVATF
jgi:TonB-linked SusC/RagA family outer membrane protein